MWDTTGNFILLKLFKEKQIEFYTLKALLPGLEKTEVKMLRNKCILID